MIKNESRKHWSYSAINQYLRCPLQYYFQRILKLPQPSVGSGLVLGSSVHHALAVYHGYLKENKEPVEQQIQQEYLETWLLKEKEQIVEYKAKESRDDLLELGMELVKLYMAEQPPQEIVAIEQRFLIPLHNSEGEYLETPLLAFTDLITKEADILKVTEFKTSGRSYGEFEVETSMQATCYVNAVIETIGEMPSVEYAVLVKTKTPKLQRLKTARTEYDLGRLGDLIQNVEKAVNNQIFYPIESPLNCSTCGYRQQCREWKPAGTTAHQNIEIHELNGAGA
ncbi:RecB family exonuclease [Rubinisphaera italica]|uniref:PD-(D/E)XK nuclease superfamily protein n=1 Tax=Rubinisphaera italica TaxID=2527969 RepID=A0A5C5XDE3_9PLAN|nr:PD-(D/E)XK nuclease family protein [Rubinisphaera italica]TWT60828.1 PD-(D/E)XK nuclease superfamily protein [Rubinisphaera italica]